MRDLVGGPAAPCTDSGTIRAERSGLFGAFENASLTAGRVVLPFTFPTGSRTVSFFMTATAGTQSSGASPWPVTTLSEDDDVGGFGHSTGLFWISIDDTSVGRLAEVVRWDGSAASLRFFGSLVPVAGITYHLTSVWDTTTATLTHLVNGQVVAVHTSITKSNLPGTTRLSLGWTGRSFDYFAGQISNFKVWNRAITVGQAQQVYSDDICHNPVMLNRIDPLSTYIDDDSVAVASNVYPIWLAL